MGETLLIAQLHPRQIENTVLHRANHALPLAGMGALIERGDDAERQMQSGAGIADLRARDQRRTIAKAGCGRRAAGALRDIFINLAVFIRTRPETLHRRINHARVKFLNALPSESHTVEHTRREIFDEHIAGFDQALENFEAFLFLVSSVIERLL